MTPPPTNMSRSPGAPPLPKSAANCARSRTARARCSTAPAARRTRRATSTACSPGSTATTTCPTAPTCATRPPPWRCRKASACRSAPSTLDDFAKTDCILFFGQNPGSNSPRMLHPLQEASERGVPIVAFNPLRERGLERFTNPQSPTEMLTGQRDPHRLAVPPGEGRRRPRGADRHLQGGARLHDEAEDAGQPRSWTMPSSPSIPAASTTSSPGCARRTGTSWSAAPGCHGRRWRRRRSLCAGRRRPSASTAWA